MNGFTDKNSPKLGPLCGMSGKTEEVKAWQSLSVPQGLAGVIFPTSQQTGLVGVNPTTLLNGVAHEGVFSCARDRHGADAVACPL
jgi:hypothetical protein